MGAPRRGFRSSGGGAGEEAAEDPPQRQDAGGQHRGDGPPEAPLPRATTGADEEEREVEDQQKPPERLSSTMTVASNPEVPRSKRYFVTCAIWTEKSIAAASSGMPNTPAMMSGRALSHRSFGPERPAYSANSSDIAHQHMGRFRQDAGRNADRARGPPQTVGRTHSQLGSSGPGHCD